MTISLSHQYQVISFISEGAHGTVSLARDHSGNMVAIKFMRNNKYLENEYSIFKYIEQQEPIPGIPRLLGVSLEKKALIIEEEKSSPALVSPTRRTISHHPTAENRLAGYDSPLQIDTYK